MTAILTRLLGRIPVGWLQLMHNKGRLAAALAGVAFANLLVFVQLGIMASMNTSIVASYELLTADIMISAEDANTLTEGGNVPRQHMFQALSVRAVEAAAPLYIGSQTWTPETGESVSFQVFGFDPGSADFIVPEIAVDLPSVRRRDTALLDVATRGLEDIDLTHLSPTEAFRFELGGRTISAIGSLSVGGGFSADGNLIVSDQTFFGLFPARSARAPDHILVNVRDGFEVDDVANAIRAALTSEDVRVRSLADAAAEDQLFQTTERPTGLIFGFGVVIGIMVGIVIVYQVLATDVADHLGEYATFKAMGYDQRFFLGIVFEEAVVLALFGFVPGLLLSWGFYIVLAALTGLPISMDLARASMVLIGTLLACTVSGAVATRRLAGADPADLF